MRRREGRGQVRGSTTKNTKNTQKDRTLAIDMTRRAILGLLIAPAALSLSGCGYALSGRGSFLPSYIKVVGVPLLENLSTFLDIENLLTERTRNELIGRGRYRVVADTTAVDAVLSGTITGVSVSPIGFTEQNLASRYAFVLVMKVAFTSVSTGEALWSNDSMTFRGEYELNTRGVAVVVGATFVAQERAAFDRIATDVARTVVSAVLEAF